MRNPVIFYGLIVIGLIALAVGVFYLTGSTPHPTRAYTGLGVGIVCLIVGIAGLFMGRSRA